MWTNLNSTYVKPSRRHIKQLKLQLKQLTKGTKSIDDYIYGLNPRFDQLALLGNIIDHEDQIDTISEGLLEDYKSAVDQMEGRDALLFITEFHEKLVMKSSFNLLLQPILPRLLSRPMLQTIVEKTTITEVTTTITIARTRLGNNINDSFQGQIKVLHARTTVDVRYASFMVIALVGAPSFTEIPLSLLQPRRNNILLCSSLVLMWRPLWCTTPPIGFLILVRCIFVHQT
ncbi:Retrovirus-related Pol polyprotein from transposon RE1 [Cardamine amara subsp. amara]|uniref:Retrovirus-related Pol polyprotein from transposon RE1 n=1 Tax=Cardamine amara subsp. amara TaxID=228776 RepID=A0ABD0ZAW0_CARAN